MGAFCSGGSEDLRVISNAIDAQINKDRKKKSVKILLLGTGESGKSTLAKQAKIIHDTGFTPDERDSIVRTIISNVMEGILTLVSLVKREGVRSSFKPETLEEMDFFANNVTSETNLSNTVIQATTTIWADPAVKDYLQKNLSKFKASDSLRYYLDNWEGISKPDYSPTLRDILLARTRSTGITEYRFQEANVSYLFVDVGGQRSERKKWIHCFQDVSAIIFCVALSEYDQVLEEDKFTNRMEEAYNLFKEMLIWFSNTRFIIVFTKEDLFREKISRVDLKTCFPSYTDGCDFEKARAFIEDHFKKACKSDKLNVYTINTTDTERVRSILKEVKPLLIDASVGYDSCPNSPK
eukprot:TRINITY_DN996_c0_g1_i1.p1 TRINITY_DN996_c0_g1~~TRINITY_DN996_c0_g1_i1.p1  ORF type:complete len:352 (-),score=52.24 TRINITY_DN996_c0_g1_i1:103-1158(-)